jgi:hypothetical protein
MKAESTTKALYMNFIVITSRARLAPHARQENQMGILGIRNTLYVEKGDGREVYLYVAFHTRSARVQKRLCKGRSNDVM